MAWSTPKTNWLAADPVDFNTLNRIESNISLLAGGNDTIVTSTDAATANALVKRDASGGAAFNAVSATTLEVTGNYGSGYSASFAYPGTGAGGIQISGYADHSKGADWYKTSDATVRFGVDDGTKQAYFYWDSSNHLLFDPSPSSQVPAILLNTASGADSSALYITGAGDSTTGRGAYLALYGNQATSSGGNAGLFAGYGGELILGGNLGLGQVDFLAFGPSTGLGVFNYGIQFPDGSEQNSAGQMTRNVITTTTSSVSSGWDNVGGSITLGPGTYRIRAHAVIAPGSGSAALAISTSSTSATDQDMVSHVTSGTEVTSFIEKTISPAVSTTYYLNLYSTVGAFLAAQGGTNNYGNIVLEAEKIYG